MNLKTLLTGIKLILTTNPLDVLKSWAVGDSEEARAIRYAVHSINFLCANIGILILILSAYLYFEVTSPDIFKITDTSGHTFTINDFKNMNPACLTFCNGTISATQKDFKRIP